MDEQQRFCPSCGTPNPVDAAFCATCGRPLAAVLPPAQAPATNPPVAEGAALPPPPPPALPVTMPPPTDAPPPAAAPPPAPIPPPVAFPPPPPTAYPTPMAPVQFPGQRQLSGGQKTGQFFGGLGLGLAGFAAIAVLTSIASNLLFGLFGGNGTGVTPFIPIALFLALIGVMAYLLAKPNVRWLGYGILAAIVALPVIAVVGCVVILVAVSHTG